MQKRKYGWKCKAGALLTSSLLCYLIAEVILRVVPSRELDYLTDDQCLWVLQPNQIVVGGSRTTINSHGFRGAELPAKGERLRVLALGCSFTHGSGVADEETFSAQLEGLSGGQLEVINAGVPGWGVFQMENRLGRCMDELAPDVVLVTIFQWAVLRQPFETEEERLQYIRSGKRRNAVRGYSRVLTVVGRKLRELGLVTFGQATPNTRIQQETKEGGPTEVFQECWTRDESRLLAMKELCEQHGATFVLMAWPRDSVNKPFFRARMARFGEMHGIQVIDLSDSLDAHGAHAWQIPHDGHPNVFGHRLAAEEIWSKAFAVEPHSRFSTSKRRN